MYQLPIEQQILLVVEITALAVLCLRMWVSKLHKAYAWFFGYLVLELAQSLIPLLIPLNSQMYRDSYVASQALLMAVYALVVLELYSNVLRDFGGIARVARRVVYMTLAIGTVTALLLLALRKPYATLTGYLQFSESVVMSALAVFVLLLTFFLVYYPVPLGRNVVGYLIGYAAYFLTSDATSLVLAHDRRANRSMSSISMAVSALCFLFWLVALSPEGERKKMVVGHQWNPNDEQKLRAQLEAINATLLRAGGKS